MNRWKLTDEIRGKYLPIVKDFIERVENNDLEINDCLEMDLSDVNLNPSRLQDLLEELGYTKEEMDTNGWQWDFWIVFTKQNYRTLQISGCGMTFELKLEEYED